MAEPIEINHRSWDRDRCVLRGKRVLHLHCHIGLDTLAQLKLISCFNPA
jgi:hypothetical protein